MAEARYNPTYIPGQNVPLGVQRLAYSNPLEDVLSSVENFAEHQAVTGAQQSATADVLSGGNPSAKLGITPAGQAHNAAAERAYAARSEGVLRTKANELALQFDGRNPTDPDSFAKVYGAVAKEVVSSVPEQFRAPIAYEAQVRATEATAKIRGLAQEHSFKLDVAAINDGWKFDVQDAASAAQLGRDDLMHAALAKAEAKAASLVELGVINPESAALMMREGREDVAVETLYRGFLDGHITPGDIQSGRIGGPSGGPVDPAAYDTKLTPAEEAEFQKWRAANVNPRDSGEDYDFRGAWKANEKSAINATDGQPHWSDRFKKPNHPTFSNESQYAKDRPDLAGKWDGERYIRPEPTGLSARSRDRLVNKMEAEIAHRRSEQNHAMAVAAHQERLRSNDATQIARAMDAGVEVGEEARGRLNLYLNTPGALSPEALEKAAVARASFGISRTVATATPQQIEEVAAGWNMSPPTSTAEAEVRGRYVKAFEHRERALNDDAATYAATVLPDKFPPIILPDATAGMDADVALKAAAERVGLLRAQFGGDRSPFSKAQTQDLARRLATMTAGDRAAYNGRIAETFGEDAHVVHEALNKEGAVIDAAIGRLTMEGRPDLAQQVAEGHEALSLGNLTVPPKANVQAAVAETNIPAAFPDNDSQKQIRKAALALAARRAGAGGSIEDELPQALKDVGGDVRGYRNQAIALPPGVTDLGDFADRIEAVADSDIIAMGGLPVIGEHIRSGDFYLRSLGGGQYAVVIGNTWATRSDGEPFILDYSKITQPSRVPRGGYPVGTEVGR